ncbi:condensation domain-containing protein, partial [Streptomyces sp. NPDC005209]|uniref:condensation domain-containing protein n=1 Tax=Streptomyces sp. NPDC005209 TaxID=3156715 RepID=UPI0033A30AE6
EEVAEAVSAACGHLFHLERDLPFHAELIEHDGDGDTGEVTLVLVMHHIATDGWSMGPLTADLSAAYAARRDGRAPSFTPLPVQYADFALWQREQAESERAGLEFWRSALAGMPEELALPVDRPRPAQPSYRGGQVRLPVDVGLAGGLRELARAHNASPFMVAHAASAALLNVLGAGTDVPLGTVVSGRSDQALTDVVGFFVNSLVLRTDTSGNPTFGELLERVRSADLAAFEHQDVPFDLLVEELQPARSLSRHPLFQVSLTWESAPEPLLELAGAHSTLAEAPFDVAKFDLEFGFAEEAGGGLALVVGYARDLFDRVSAQEFGDRLLRLLGQVVADPETRLSALGVLSDAEVTEALVRGRGPVATPPASLSSAASSTAPAAASASSVVGVLRERVAGCPEAVALEWDGGELSYGELLARAESVASGLLASGVGREQVVPVLMERSADAVVALLGVLLAGGAYLPVHTA